MTPVINIQPIHSDDDYEIALAQIQDLLNARKDSPEADVLDILLALVRDWEQQQGYKLLPPDPIAAIKFRMEQQNLSQRALMPYIGSLSKISEVLSGKRSLSLAMIRSLSTGLGIPAEVLLKAPAPSTPKEIQELCKEPARFPLKEMKKRGWFSTYSYDLKDQAEELLNEWLGQLNDIRPPVAVFPRATRQTAKTDKYALFAWCVKILLKANEVKTAKKYTKGCINFNFLEDLKKLSLMTNGPKLAVKKLQEQGVRVIIEDHLPKTHLDGALISLNDEPVIGLTLRYDRIDNFWFTLFHELAHLINDFDNNSSDALFLDDMTLDSNSGNLSEIEEKADKTAKEALISLLQWQQEIEENALPSSTKIIELAFKWQVHPAIIAGRLRYIHKNYRLFPDFVGTGEIKCLFQ